MKSKNRRSSGAKEIVKASSKPEISKIALYRVILSKSMEIARKTGPFLMISLIIKVAIYKFGFFNSDLMKKNIFGDQYRNIGSIFEQSGYLWDSILLFSIFLVINHVSNNYDVNIMLCVIPLMDEGFSSIISHNPLLSIQLLANLIFIYLSLRLFIEEIVFLSLKWWIFLILSLFPYMVSRYFLSESFVYFFSWIISSLVSVYCHSKLNLGMIGLVVLIVFVFWIIWYMIELAFGTSASSEVSYTLRDIIEEFTLLQWKMPIFIPIIVGFLFSPFLQHRKLQMFIIINTVISLSILYPWTPINHNTITLRIYNCWVSLYTICSISICYFKHKWVSYFIAIIIYTLSWIYREKFIPFDLDFL